MTSLAVSLGSGCLPFIVRLVLKSQLPGTVVHVDMEGEERGEARLGQAQM